MYICVCPFCEKVHAHVAHAGFPFLFLPNSSVLRVMSKLSGFGINLGVQREGQKKDEGEGGGDEYLPTPHKNQLCICFGSAPFGIVVFCMSK